MPPYRTDRVDRPGGCVVTNVRGTFMCIRRDDLEIRGLETVWVEVTLKGKLILVGGFYRPPNSNNAYLNLIAESFDRACNIGIDNIIITGDFNFNMLSNDERKMKTLINQFNLEKVISHYVNVSVLIKFSQKTCVTLIIVSSP